MNMHQHFAGALIKANNAGQAPITMARVNSYIGKVGCFSSWPFHCTLDKHPTLLPQSNWADLAFDGFIDNLRVYTSALTDADVADLYTSDTRLELSVLSIRTGFLGHWTFDERSGKDSSPVGQGHVYVVIMTTCSFCTERLLFITQGQLGRGTLCQFPPVQCLEAWGQGWPVRLCD